MNTVFVVFVCALILDFGKFGPQPGGRRDISTSMLELRVISSD